MGPLSWLADVRNYLLLRHYVRQGLRLGRDVRIMGKPDFGSEPYLIEIGDHVTISSRVTFVTHDGATWVFRHLPQYRGLQRFGRIVIEDNCFIGTGAIILPGVRLGPNAVGAAGGVGTRSGPPGHGGGRGPGPAGLPLRRVRPPLGAALPSLPARGNEQSSPTATGAT